MWLLEQTLAECSLGKKEGSSDLKVQVRVHHRNDVTVAGAGEAHHAHSQEQKETNALMLACAPLISPLSQGPRPSAQVVVPPTAG